MGDYKAAIGLLVTITGFIVMFGIISLIQFIAYDSAQDTTFTYTDISGSIVTSSKVFSGSCESPRYIVNPQDGSTEKLLWNRDSAQCKHTIGSLSEENCDEIIGCTWSNASSFLLFFEVPASCDGYINLTNYTRFTNQTTGYFTPTTLEEGQIHTHGPSVYYAREGKSTFSAEPICPIFEDRATCEFFGCTYIDPQTAYDNFEDLSSASKIWNTVKGIAAFSIDLGLDGEADFWVSTIFYLLVLIILIQVYFILPFLHG